MPVSLRRVENFRRNWSDRTCMEMPSRAGCKTPHGCGTHRSVVAGQPSLGAFEYRSTSTCCLGPSTRVSSRAPHFAGPSPLLPATIFSQYCFLLSLICTLPWTSFCPSCRSPAGSPTTLEIQPFYSNNCFLDTFLQTHWYHKMDLNLPLWSIS